MLIAVEDTEITYFPWLSALGNSTVSFISNFHLRVALDVSNKSSSKDGEKRQAERLCRVVRERVASGKIDITNGLMAALYFLGLDPHTVKFVAPPSVATVDDALNKVLGEAWEKRAKEGGWEQLAIETAIEELCKDNEAEVKKDGLQSKA